MKKNITTILALLALSVSASAQKQDSLHSSKFSHSIGFNYGTTTGKGLSYQLSTGKLNFQIAGFPLIEKNSKSYNVGLAAMYKFRDKKYVDLLSYVGVNYLYDWQKGVEYYDYKYPDITTTQTNVGLGLGFEFDTQYNLKMRLMGGYGAYFAKDYEIAPSFEASIFYKL